MIQKRIANYQLLAELGEGQFGKVYKAYDLRENRWVAIKSLPVAMVGSNPKFRDFLILCCS